MRTNPPSPPASSVKARPLAANGNCAVVISNPAAVASSGDSPAVTISGSVKQIASTKIGSKRRRAPAIISAPIAPCAAALCASIGSPTRSPTAQTLRIAVRHWSSTLRNGPALSPPFSSRPPFAHGPCHLDPHPLEPPVFGQRPSPDRDDDLVGFDRDLFTVRDLDRELPLVVEPADPSAEMQFDPRALQPASYRPGQCLVIARQDAIRRLDDRHRRAQFLNPDAH